MGRSQGKSRTQKKLVVSRGEKSTLTKTEVARLVLLISGHNYLLRGVGNFEQAIFQSPDLLIDILRSKDINGFWAAIENQDIDFTATNAKSLRKMFKDPVFSEFLKNQLDQATREMRGFQNPDSHWMAHYDFSEAANAELFKEEFAKRFVEALNNPAKRFNSINEFLIGSEILDRYSLSSHFSEKLSTARQQMEKDDFYSFIEKDMSPIVTGRDDEYAAANTKRIIISYISELESDANVLKDPAEYHNRLIELLGPDQKLSGNSYYYRSLPWNFHGAKSTISSLVNKKWTESGGFKKDDFQNIGQEVLEISFSKQLATVLSKDYRQKTTNENYPEKLRYGIGKVKSTKTMFRRLKPIFDNEGKEKEFNQLMKMPEVESMSDSKMILLIEAVSKDFVEKYKFDDPSFDKNSVSLSDIFIEKVKSV